MAASGCSKLSDMEGRIAMFQGNENYMTIMAAMRALSESMKRQDLQDLDQTENMADFLADGDLLLDIVQHIADLNNQPIPRKRSLRSTPSKGKSMNRFDLCVNSALKL